MLNFHTMFSEVSNYTLFEMGQLRGQKIELCRYQYYHGAFNEGLVLKSAFHYFFIRIERKEIAGKLNLDYIITKYFHNCEIDERFSFTPLFEGVLDDLMLLSKKTSTASLANAIVNDIECECAILLKFEAEHLVMIYPEDQLFTRTSYSLSTDTTLEKMFKYGFTESRKALMDPQVFEAKQQRASLLAV